MTRARRRDAVRNSLVLRLALAVGACVATGCSAVVTVEPVGAVPATLAAADWNGTWCNPAAGLPAELPAVPGKGDGDHRAAATATATPPATTPGRPTTATPAPPATATPPAEPAPAGPVAPAPPSAAGGDTDRDVECMQFEVSPGSPPGELTMTDLDDGDRYPAFVRTDAAGKVLFVTIRDEGKLVWARASREKDLILAWLPATDAFKSLVGSGAMPGTVEPGTSGDVLLGRLNPAQRAVIEADAARTLFQWTEPMVFVRVRR